MSVTALWAIAKGLAANWQYAVITALFVWGGLERMHYLDCKAGRAADSVAQAEAVAAFQQADAAKARAIQDSHAAKIARLKGEANVRERAIMRSASSTACLNSPAARAFIDGLPVGAASADTAAGAGRAGTAVPR